MIADRLTNLGNYPQLAPYQEDITSFIEKAMAGLPDGRYEIRGENLFALVQHYTNHPAEGSLMEAHDLYADLQCVLSGRERIFVDYAAELTIIDDRRPGADCMFFASRPHKGYNIIDAGSFGYYAPSDAHMPGVEVEEPEEVFKIVFKIRM